MTSFQWVALVFAVAATALHVATVALAMHRCWRRSTPVPAFPAGPAVSIIRPVCGLDAHEEMTLRSGFLLDYPDYELVFCCASGSDPAAALVRRLIDEHPHVKARLLIGNHVISANAKLNNVVKGWAGARAEWVIMADSNVAMPRDYIQRLLLSWRTDTGILCSPPIGSMAVGFWAELECAFLNTYQARWQYAADSVGLGFAQGKTMLMRRSDLERGGGMHALAGEPAEDAAATKLVRGLGLRARLVDAPFPQPLGSRMAAQVWARQSRWAQLRRATFPAWFSAEILTGCLLPLLAAAHVATVLEWEPTLLVGVLAAIWFAGEAALALAAGWQLSVWSPLAWILRDLLLPAIWVHAWLSNRYEWRGNEVRTADGSAVAR